MGEMLTSQSVAAYSASTVKLQRYVWGQVHEDFHKLGSCCPLILRILILALVVGAHDSVDQSCL